VSVLYHRKTKEDEPLKKNVGIVRESDIYFTLFCEPVAIAQNLSFWWYSSFSFIQAIELDAWMTN